MQESQARTVAECVRSVTRRVEEKKATMEQIEEFLAARSLPQEFKPGEIHVEDADLADAISKLDYALSVHQSAMDWKARPGPMPTGRSLDRRRKIWLSFLWLAGEEGLHARDLEGLLAKFN